MQEIYPNCLKIAEVTAIYKKSEANLATNYTPISILSKFDKIYEKILHSTIYNGLKKYNLVINKQYGFRQNSSPIYVITT